MVSNFDRVKETPWSLFGGLSGMPGRVEGLADIEVIDSKLFRDQKEKRLKIPLSDDAPFLNLGGVIGAEYNFSSLLALTFDFRIGLASPGKSVISSAMLGTRIKYHLFPDILVVGISPKIGGSFFYTSLGKVMAVEDEYVSISVRDGYIEDQDNVFSLTIGFSIQLIADIRLSLGQSGFFLYAETGYMYTFVPKGGSALTLSFSRGSNRSSDSPRGTVIGSDIYVVDAGSEGNYPARESALKEASIRLDGLVLTLGIGISF